MPEFSCILAQLPGTTPVGIPPPPTHTLWPAPPPMIYGSTNGKLEMPLLGNLFICLSNASVLKFITHYS